MSNVEKAQVYIDNLPSTVRWRPTLSDIKKAFFDGLESGGGMAEALEEAILETEKEYNSFKRSADLFNNNTPGVGQTVDYQSYPALPKWIEKAKAALGGK